MQQPTTGSLERSTETLAAAGLTVGIVVSAGVAIAGLMVEPWSVAIGVGILGIPSAAILGWRFGPSVGGASIGNAARIVVTMGVLASFGSAIVLGSLVSLGSISSGGPSGLIFVPLALLYAIPALVITIPAALAWAVLMRLLTGGRT